MPTKSKSTTAKKVAPKSSGTFKITFAVLGSPNQELKLKKGTTVASLVDTYNLKGLKLRLNEVDISGGNSVELKEGDIFSAVPALKNG